MIVLAIDGMDHRLVQRYLAEGRLPNIKRLSDRGALKPLSTTMPPQSPVAWSTFITGANPGHHGIFDFIHREPGSVGDPLGFSPHRSSSAVEEARRRIAFRSLVLPLAAGRAELLRRGVAFWEPLADAGVPVTLIRMPANFPPVPSRARCLTGMDTPDLLGTSGTFTFYFELEEEGGGGGGPGDEERSVGGGRLVPVTVEGGKVEATLRGPPHPLRRAYGEAPRPDLLADFSVWIDRESRAAKFEVQDTVFILREGEWSEWVPVGFQIFPLLSRIQGICRFFLKEVRPGFKLYVSPINIDPADPALPISDPESFAPEMARALGPFYTQEMAEDTKALTHGVLSDGEYLQQAKMVLAEQMGQLRHALEEYSGGLLYFYFSSIDQNSHVFWRAIDPKHPLYTPELAKEFGSVIPELYEEMDRAIGKAMEKIGPETVLVVMSDHGFTSFRRSFNLNTWLLEEGYAWLLDPSSQGETELFGNVDWQRTRAYALGLNGLYLNLRGREGAGIVSPGEEADRLLVEISEKLLAAVDPETGERIVTRVFRTSKTHPGAEAAQAPDLLVAYNDGYRVSWESVLGEFPREVLVDNREKWSGDHCIDPEIVPGILVSDRPISLDDPSLTDMAPTILSWFGVASPEAVEGRALLGDGP